MTTTKLCGHCDRVLDNHRRTYHPECLPAVKVAAQLSRRRCSKCRKTKAASKFSNDATRADGKFPWCIACQVTGSPAKRFQDSSADLNGHVCPVCDTHVRGHKNRRFCSAKCKDRNKALGQKFGLTIEQYRTMVKATDGLCPLCKCRPRVWAVDHDHQTGLVAGVVCTGCNVGILAGSRHELARAQALVEYLADTPAARLGILARVPDSYIAPPSKLHKMWDHPKDAA